MRSRVDRKTRAPSRGQSPQRHQTNGTAIDVSAALARKAWCTRDPERSCRVTRRELRGEGRERKVRQKICKKKKKNHLAAVLSTGGLLLASSVNPVRRYSMRSLLDGICGSKSRTNTSLNTTVTSETSWISQLKYTVPAARAS